MANEAESSRSRTREEAQRRADRIRVFREELSELEREQAVRLTEEQRAAIERHHASLLQRFAKQFDVDTTEAEKRLSLGMRIASFLGALALAAAVFFFFYRFWGYMGTPLQVVLLVAAPVAAVAAVEYAACRERTFYFAGLIGLLAFACFVLDLTVLGSIFNITPSPKALLAWAAFAGILAYTYGLRLLLVAGILAFMGYLSAEVGVWKGCYWLNFGQRPENFLLSGAVLFFVPSFLRHREMPGFPPMYRLFGLLAILVPILVLANWGEVSYLGFEADDIEVGYQIVGFALATLAIWAGIRRSWNEVTNLGSVFFVILLYTKLFQWWWEWMPKWVFFSIVGAVAVAILLLLRKVHALQRRTSP